MFRHPSFREWEVGGIILNYRITKRKVGKKDGMYLSVKTKKSYVGILGWYILKCSTKKTIIFTKRLTSETSVYVLFTYYRYMIIKIILSE